jgi:hypothetical protein
VVIIAIYGRFTNAFIFVIVNDLEIFDTQALAIFPKFYSVKNPTTLLIKNIGILVFGEQF